MIMATQKIDGLTTDIRQLCISCANAVVAIAEKHNEDPRLVSEVFINAYSTINSKLGEFADDKE